METAGFTRGELKLFRSLNTPAKIQTFLNSIPTNFEHDGKDTAKSPLMVLRTNSAHCLEGAVLGAYILSWHGYPPLLMHLETRHDWNHIIAPFKEYGCWGALSKTNHAVLRYREPIYRTLHELVLSYFHEYTTDDGKKTLRRYSKPLSLHIFEDSWPTETEDLWGIDEALEEAPHYDIAPPAALRRLRRADLIEREAGKLTEWKASSG